MAAGALHDRRARRLHPLARHNRRGGAPRHLRQVSAGGARRWAIRRSARSLPARLADDHGGASSSPAAVDEGNAAADEGNAAADEGNAAADDDGRRLASVTTDEATIARAQTLGLHVLHALHTHLLPRLQAPCTIVALAVYILSHGTIDEAERRAIFVKCLLAARAGGQFDVSAVAPRDLLTITRRFQLTGSLTEADAAVDEGNAAADEGNAATDDDGHRLASVTTDEATIARAQTLGLHVLHALHTHLLPWLQAPCTIVALAVYILSHGTIDEAERRAIFVKCLLAARAGADDSTSARFAARATCLTITRRFQLTGSRRRRRTPPSTKATPPPTTTAADWRASPPTRRRSPAPRRSACTCCTRCTRTCCRGCRRPARSSRSPSTSSRTAQSTRRSAAPSSSSVCWRRATC